MSGGHGGVLRVVKVGPLALVEDAGRFGVRHLGVTQGGALDWVSLGWANWLLGNDPRTAGIEIAVGGLALEASKDLQLALAGADLGATLDGESIAPGRRFDVRAGQTLSFAQPLGAGVRAYLALPGGIDAAPFMGSLSSVVREGLGGLDGLGTSLAVGDALGWRGEAGRSCPTPEAEMIPAEPSEEAAITLDLIAGAQIAHFDGESLFAAFNAPWEVDSRADRMGVRLTGPVLRCGLGGMISEGIPLGAVQVPPDGQPIILLNDRQTVGGYPRLGALSPLACARLGQCAPGTALRLRVVSPSQARRAYLRQWVAWQA